jgi:hypothetical protein
MTIAKLKSYRGIRAELDDISAELGEHETLDCVQSAATPPYSKHSVTVSGLPPDDRVISLLERQAVLRAVKGEIERFVDGIEDSEIRRIIQYRYILGKKKRSWQFIAMRLGYCSENTPKYKLKKYFSDCGFCGKSML